MKAYEYYRERPPEEHSLRSSARLVHFATIALLNGTIDHSTFTKDVEPFRDLEAEVAIPNSQDRSQTINTALAFSEIGVLFDPGLPELYIDRGEDVPLTLRLDEAGKPNFQIQEPIGEY